jgi:hypothetical protein
MLAAGCSGVPNEMSTPDGPDSAHIDRNGSSASDEVVPVVEAMSAAESTAVTVSNHTERDRTVYVAFSSSSAVGPHDWKFCHAAGPLNCQFPLKANGTRSLPLTGMYLNATLSFGSPVGCGSTKAELNVNNPSWYDQADVSLVDGFSDKIVIHADDKQLGPPNGAADNEGVYGLYPLGCDICVARQAPPCGFPAGQNAGCKDGTQNHPDVPCQWKGARIGGGSTIHIALVP